MIPYGRQSVSPEDTQAVVEVLKSDWLTTGPAVERFEKAVADIVGASHAVAVNSGTAALHCAVYAAGIDHGDEVIVPPITFSATANSAVYLGAKPVFADVDPETLLIDPLSVAEKIGSNTRAIIAVDYAGQPCDWDELQTLADANGLCLIDDACHALGAVYKDRPIGSVTDMSAFSFHPVKHITTGEGGMVTTNQADFAEKMRRFRNHGISRDHHQRHAEGAWHYEMVDLGYNYRLSDIQCALGTSQLRRLPQFLDRRSRIAEIYDRAFNDLPGIQPLKRLENRRHVYHLYVIRISPEIGRERVFEYLRKHDIGANVHYIPVHLHPFYRERFGTRRGMCPVAEAAYEQILTLPIFPTMMESEIDFVIEKVAEAARGAVI